MLIEALLDSLLSNFDSGGGLGSFISSFFEILSYIGYFDNFFPVSTIISCLLFMVGWIIICAIVKIVLMVI